MNESHAQGHRVVCPKHPIFQPDHQCTSNLSPQPNPSQKPADPRTLSVAIALIPRPGNSGPSYGGDVYPSSYWLISISLHRPVPVRLHHSARKDGDSPRHSVSPLPCRACSFDRAISGPESLLPSLSLRVRSGRYVMPSLHTNPAATALQHFPNRALQSPRPPSQPRLREQTSFPGPPPFHQGSVPTALLPLSIHSTLLAPTAHPGPHPASSSLLTRCQNLNSPAEPSNPDLSPRPLSG